MTSPTVYPPRTITARPVLVGREREAGMLRDHLAGVLGGHGGLVLIGGEAGIGKTALAEALCQEAAAQNALVLIGRCYDRTETPPYGPWLELFAHYPTDATLPTIPAAFVERGMVAPVENQSAIFQQVQRFLDGITTSCPLVLFLDDLHWADPASLDLLRSVARMTARLPFLLLVTYRADELTRHHPLHHLLPLLERESPASRLNLQPLAAGAVRALIEARYQLTEADAVRLTTYLHQRAEGNAFFTTELLRALEEGSLLHHAEHGWMLGELALLHVPVPLRQVIDGRLARLGEEAQPLLAVAAVIGQDIPLDLWSTVTGADEEALSAIIEQALMAHLMDEAADGTRARFVHALIREALYEGILPSRRRRIHRQVGEALMTRANADPDAVAHHFRQAGDGRAAAWLVKAGDRAERAYAWISAAERYTAAVDIMEKNGTDAAAQGWLLLRLSWLRRWGDPHGGIASLERAARLADAVGDRALAGCVLFFNGILHCRTQQHRRGIADMRAAVAALDALSETDDLQFRTLDMVGADFTPYRRWGTLAMWLGYAGYLDEARTICERVLVQTAGSSAPGDSTVAGEVNSHYGLGWVHATRGSPDDAIEAFARASAISRATGNLAGAAQSLLDGLHWAVLPYKADHLVQRRRQATMAEELWAQTSDVLPTDNSPQFPQLSILFLEGKWNEARHLALLQRVTEIPTRRRYLAIPILATIARNQGDTALAWELVHEFLPTRAIAPGDVDYLIALFMQCVAASLALEQGDLTLSHEWLAMHDHWCAWNQAVLGQADGQLGWANYHRAAGDRIQACRHANQALAYASEPRQPLALLAAHRLIGELDTDAGRCDDATAHLADALALADACAAPYERALTLLAQAELCAAVGKRDDALALLDAVRAICTPLCAKLALARVDALATALTPLPVTPPTYPDGMTDREVQVLRHIAAGMSNREIAAVLSVSIRTVERHIENLYRKIDVRSKAEATAYAFRHNLS